MPGGTSGKEPACQYSWQKMKVQCQGGKNFLEREMAIHSSVLAWRIPRTEEPGRLQGRKERDTTEVTALHNCMMASRQRTTKHSSALNEFTFTHIRTLEKIKTTCLSSFWFKHWRKEKGIWSNYGNGTKNKDNSYWRRVSKKKKVQYDESQNSQSWFLSHSFKN